MLDRSEKIDKIIERHIQVVDGKKIIQNFKSLKDTVLNELHNAYGFTPEKIDQCTCNYNIYTRVIQFETEQALRENEYFKVLYSNLCPKYKGLLDTYIKSLEYRSVNRNRGYRSKEKFLDVMGLTGFYVYSCLGFDMLEYHEGKIDVEYPWTCNFAALYTSEFMVNTKLLDYFKGMVYDNEGVQNMSDDIIKGVIQSNNSEAIQAVFDLFKAAKLSEGLRLAIVSNIDYGSIDTFKMFLDYIRSEKLVRFSSVKTAILLYTGLSIYDKKSQEKCVEYIMDCVLDNKTKEYLEDENPLKVYTALYSLAIINKDDAYNYIIDQYKIAKGYRRSCFITFLARSGCLVSSDVITHCLNNEDDISRIGQIIDWLPQLTFENLQKKRDYIISFLQAVKNIKSSTRYSMFNDDYECTVSADYKYMKLLQYVYECGDDELYKLAYLSFGKFAVRPDIISRKYNSNIKPQDTFLNEIYHPAQRKALIDNLGRYYSYEILVELDLDFTEEEYFELAKKLKTKRSDLRNNICSFFKKADSDIILKVSKYLIEQKKDELKNGGLSILVDNLDNVRSLKEFRDIQDIIREKEFSHEILTLKDMILGEIQDKSPEEEEITIEVPTLTWDSKLVEKITHYDFTLMKALANKWWDMFSAHKGEEMEITLYNGSKEVRVIGTNITTVYFHHNGLRDVEKKYKKYYFYEEFLAEFEELNDEEIALLYFMKNIVNDYVVAYNNQQSNYPNNQQKEVLECLDFYSTHGVLPDLTNMCKFICDTVADKDAEVKFENFQQVLSLLYWYYSEEHQKLFVEVDSYNKTLLNYFAFNIEFYKHKLDKLPSCFNDTKHNDLKKTYWNNGNVLGRCIFFDDAYAYAILENLFNLYDKEYSPVESHVYFYFLEKELMSRELLVSKLLNVNFRSPYRTIIQDISNKLISSERSTQRDKPELKYLDAMQDVYIEVTSKMLEVELKRSDSKTNYSNILNTLQAFYGIEFFVKALDKMQKIDFVRGYAYSSAGIKDVFSNIIAKTLPEDDLTQEEFNRFIKQYNISDKKLLEAALYNPHFTRLAADYLHIKGLEKAMYYFRAHSLDNAEENSISDETKKMINRYSDFELEDFVDGKMDIKWFHEIQKEMAAEDYKKVYDASKFIMGTAKRKRGQYFSDAVMGNITVADVEEKINDKRNQDMLLCFGLIPLGEGSEREKEVIRRYKRIQLFLKEAKQFGAQRRATETRKGHIALSNLATNYGLDISRFTWVMEANLIEEIKDVFEPKVIDEIELYLSLDNIKNPEIVVNKAGKKLKSIPAKYKKHEHIIKIKEAKKDIKEQFSRARITLEEAMINSDRFSIEELRLINTHPVVKEVIKSILFVSDGFIGFLKDNELINLKGEVKKLTKKSNIRIAHCTDLFEDNWSEWQGYIMEEGIVQPFKQVFRELYTLTEEEIANDGYTNRFAGYQIEGKKALGVLSSRNWLINDDDGFEKVNHAQNLRIDLYCYANWRNANVLEEETLEKVMFIDNKTNKTMNMKKLDKVLFSETMRDLDLVVSVAYVGGVDPLLNHTTLEMRKRILEYNLNLFKISNYEIKDKHIFIEGTLGKYSLHLGSGVVSVEGKGMLPMTPVHSQKRGHIFLPFVDEDPKTSEIITKVLMLAEDSKLNDPTILQFLR